MNLKKTTKLFSLLFFYAFVSVSFDELLAADVDIEETNEAFRLLCSVEYAEPTTYQIDAAKKLVELGYEDEESGFSKQRVDAGTQLMQVK